MFGQIICDLFGAYYTDRLKAPMSELPEEELRTIACMLGMMPDFLHNVPESREIYGIKMIRDLQKEVHLNAIDKGWWDNDLPRTFGDQIALFHTEISEAMLDYQNNKAIDEIYYEGKKPCGIPIELADAIIRIMDTCETYGIDLQDAIEKKMEYNKTRPFRHGGKRL